MSNRRRILQLDIETAPATVYAWGLFEQHLGINQVHTPGYILSFAAKWYGERPVTFKSLWDDGKIAMLTTAHEMLTEADAVVHFNGAQFDIPTLNKEFLEEGFLPPTAYSQIDLLKTVRKEFKFLSNRLAFLVDHLDLGQKIKTDFDLWTDVLAGDETAQRNMRLYNIRDVRLLEKLYTLLLPWISNHPNISKPVDGLPRSEQCPACGSGKTVSQGSYYTKSFAVYRRRCSVCNSGFESHRSKIK
jgi:hypothetical protein